MSNIKEPYEISVWEEELIPAQDWYVQKDNQGNEIERITKDEYDIHKEKLSFTKEDNFIKAYIHQFEQIFIDAQEYESLTEEDKLLYSNTHGIEVAYVKDNKYLTEQQYEKEAAKHYQVHTVMEHYEETQGIVIGAHDMNSVYAAINPILKKNVNGSVELTFGMYYKPFDPDAQDFIINPFNALLLNEAKVKLQFRGKWYNFVVKNCVEDSANSIFNYTCKDIYINELGKNGFRTELDSELENNQGTVTDLAETILLDTDWNVDRENSDIIVETKVEPLYIGTLNQDIKVKLVNKYLPDQYAEGIEDQPGIDNGTAETEINIEKGTEVLFFYSDIAENKKHPQILCRWGRYFVDSNQFKPMPPYLFTIGNQNYDGDSENIRENWDRDGYLTDINDDIIINAYNYEVLDDVFYIDSDLEYNIPSIVENALEIYDLARGEKVIKSQYSGYDPDLDRFIFKFYKKDSNNADTYKEYYGYTKTDILSSHLAQNYLANSDDFVSLEGGWYFDGIPSKTVKINGKEKIAAYTGQIFTKSDASSIGQNQKNGSESILALQLRPEGSEGDYYPDTQGEYYLIQPARYGTEKEYKVYYYQKNGYYDLPDNEEGDNERDRIAQEYNEHFETVIKTSNLYTFNPATGEYTLDIEKGTFIRFCDAIYRLVDSEDGKAHEENVRACFFDSRENGVEGYADKTDEELELLIKEALIANKFSTRRRLAINTGIGANRKQIENLTPEEEFLFAVSLGKYTDENNPPAYGDEVKYGAKVPLDFYEFSDATEHTTFIKKAVDNAITDTNRALSKDPLQYYLQHPEYSRVYNSEYEKETKRAEKEYEDKYLFGLNSIRLDSKDNWRSGGIRYKELFLQYLRGHDEDNNPVTFNYEGEEVKISEYIARKLYTYATSPENESVCKALYNIFISGYQDVQNKTDPTIVQRYYQGMYPTMILNTVIEAKNKQKKPWTINSRWEPMGYDEAQFPEFDEIQQDIVSTMTSFNESLFSAFYQGLKQVYITSTKIDNGFVYNWNSTVFSNWSSDGRDKIDKIIAYGASEIESLLKTIYKAAYEEGRFLNVYENAKEYKMPGVQFPEGGKIYRAYKARWEAKAKEIAMAAAEKEVSVADLFKISPALSNINLFPDVSDGETEYITVTIKENGQNVDKTIKRADLKEYYDFIIKLTDFIESKENVFKATYAVEEINSNAYNQAFNKKLIEWTEEFLKQESEIINNQYMIHGQKYDYGQYYYVNFLPSFLKYCVEEQEIGTYVLAEDKYEIDGGKLKQAEFGEDVSVDVENLDKDKDAWTLVPQLEKFNSKLNSLTAKYFTQGLYITHKTDSTHSVAIKTNFNPYLSNNAGDAGGYVFDRNEEVIRLFDPTRDMLGATYKPIKDDDGDYIFDVFEQVYRPFRNWSTEEKRHPVTYEQTDADSKIGVYGDVIKHPVKLFDGHLGSWEEEPTRYRMVRLREDPENAKYDNGKNKYQYLPKEVKIREIGYHKGKTYPYINTYPAGYQTDVYVEDKFGKYVKSTDVKKPRNTKLFLTLFGEDALWELHGTTPEEVIKVDGLTEKKTLKERFNDWWAKLTGDNKEDIEIAQSTQMQTEGGLSLLNEKENPNSYKEATTEYYEEDRPSVKTYGVTIDGTSYQLSSPIVDDVENAAEVKNAFDRGLIEREDSQAAAAASTTSSDTIIEAERYIKYKWYYWRHWFKDRYNYQPKICVQKNVNGVSVFKPFNKVEDSISEDYRVMTLEDYEKLGENKPLVSFYLKKPVKRFRSAQDLDYGTRKYRMELQDKKSKKFWVEAPNGEAYLRHYKIGDGEIKLWDGHFGKWIDCFQENQRDAEETFEGWETNDPRYPGLNVIYETTLVGNPPQEVVKEDKDGKVVKIAALPEFYLHYEDIMIPWDARVLNRDKKFTRQRVPYRETNQDELYVYSDNIYLNIDEYYINNGFVGSLNYDGLKISLIKDFKYDATNFSIANLTDNQDKYLQFDIKNKDGYDGYIDLVVSEDPISGETIKERWIYWKAAVNEQLSLTKDPLQSFGMLFETTRIPDVNNNIEPYIFLGMQMFRYIPYEKKAEIMTTKKVGEFYYKSDNLVESIEKQIKLDDPNYSYTASEALIEIYNNALGYDSDNPNNWIKNKLYTEDLEKILYILANDERRNAFVAKVFQSYGYVFNYDIQSKENIRQNKVVIEEIDTKPEIIPLFPGQPPDAKDLIRTNYYIYDPNKVSDVENVVYEYVGVKPEDKGFFPLYDKDCQKIRSIKGKESNYFKLLQDCCDTFDCWIEPIIDCDKETGKISYIEKSVYIQNNAQNNEEPQIYIGKDEKERALDKKISWYEVRFGFGSSTSRIEREEIKEKINRTYQEEGEDDNKQLVEMSQERVVQIIYTPKSNVTLTDEEKVELKELNRLANINIHLDVQYMVVPDKKIRFKRYVGQENWNGFKYGVNLKHIKRTIDSNQISTKVIVKPNKNEFAESGFCTIQRAKENPLKENFLFDFSYYAQQGLLNNSDLVNDLYTGVNTRLNYYNKIGRLNKDNDQIIEKLAGLKVDLNEVKAKYETAVLARDAAIEEINKATLNLTSNYEIYDQIIDTPWSYNKSREYETRKQTSSPEVTFNTSFKSENGETLDIIIDLPRTATAVDYPKYNDSVRAVLDQMDVYQKSYEINTAAAEKYGLEKQKMEDEIQLLLEQQQIIVEKKNELNKLFYHKYSRFIQEGSWIDESYIDDNLYYLDALSVLRTSCKPKITYDIGVVDIAAASEYETDRIVLESELGDRTYVEDTEFFGYQDDGETPYWEMVIVSEKIYNLEDASQNQTKVKNYSTQFDDLFQRIAATSQTLQFNEGSYSRAASVVKDDGTISVDLLQKTINSSDFIISNSINEEVTWDNTGITIISTEERANVVKIVSRGVLISNNGGTSYKTAITGNGINADLLTAGRIDTKMLLIGNSKTPNFFWDQLGISAFRKENNKMDYSSFVRLDQYGIYGIKNYIEEGRTKATFNNSFVPRSVKEITNNPNAVFGLTWDGFFLNASNGTGRVTIGTEQDFKMSEYFASENQWIDKVIIGRLSDSSGNEYYGFRLNGNDNQIVMETNDSGELYLKEKLRISNFNDTAVYRGFEFVENGEKVEANVGELKEEQPVLDKDGNPTVDDNGNIIKAPVSFKTYYYNYIEENGQKKKKYYTEDWILFRVEDTNIDWRDFISNPQDRVTLGIVDTYRRNYTDSLGQHKRFLQETVQGMYSSSDYLTKVMSIKANGFVGSEPFDNTGEEISRLIEDNETFAIFDNGNIYAKNAWIEGHIRATSGSFAGKIIATEGQITGRLEIGANNTSGNIFSSGMNGKGGWAINGDGTAHFNDVVVSGKISTAIFEQEKVQTIAGGMLVCPAVTVLNHINNLVVLDATGEVPGIEINAILQIGNQLGGTKVKITSVTYKTQEEYDKLVSDFKNDISDVPEDGESDITLNGNITTDGADNVESLPEDEQGQLEENEPNIEINENDGKLVCIEISPLSQQDSFGTLTKGDVLLILSYGSVQAENYGISINSRRAGAGIDEYPSQSIAIINLREPTQPPKALFGYLGSVQNEMDFEFSNLSNSYGLYCDNAYLKGTLISVTKNVDGNIINIAGLTSTDTVEVKFPGASESEYAAFFAGKSKEDLSFYVTKNGKLYAKDGYFSGIIYASKIVGNHSVEQQPALTIEAEDIKKAIVFQKEEENKVTEYLSIEQTGSFFYSKENSNGIKETLGAFVHNTDNNEVGFGLFQKDGRKDQLANYLLNFKKEVDSNNEEIVRMYHGAQPLVTITNKEFIIEGKSGSGLGDSCFVQDVVVEDKIIGVDFLLK